jgi:KRAB domain-containing zinc finger protein
MQEKYQRDQHITAVHTGEKSFSCKICPSKFSTAGLLRGKFYYNTNFSLCFFKLYIYLGHQLVHKDKRPHGCNLCKKDFKSSPQLKRHVKAVHSKRTRKFRCLECNNAFFTKSHLIQHQNVHINNNGEGFAECYFCHKKFSRSSNLVLHVKTHTQEKPFACPEKFCKYESARLGDVKKHQRRFHSSTANKFNGKIWTCYFCSKTLTQFYNLTIHMRRHTKEVPFKCNFCKKKYINLESLQRHIASHTNEKAFKCSKCYKEFKTSGDLKQHMVSHTKQKRYFCQFCSYGSYFERDINTHVLKRHNKASK